MRPNILRRSMMARWASCGCLLLAAVGCEGGLFRSYEGNLFGKKRPEPGPVVASPKDRIKALKELAKNAPKMSPADQERESLELARAIGKEEDPIFRLYIIRALAEFKTPAADAVLRVATKDADREVRVVCCEAWAKRGGPEAVGLLTDVFQTDRDLDVRIAAARCLGETKDASAIPVLAAALDDRDPAMQFRAMQSMQAITGKHFGDNVNAWREYARGGKPAEQSWAERAKRWF